MLLIKKRRVILFALTSQACENEVEKEKHQNQNQKNRRASQTQPCADYHNVGTRMTYARNRMEERV